MRPPSGRRWATRAPACLVSTRPPSGRRWATRAPALHGARQILATPESYDRLMDVARELHQLIDDLLGDDPRRALIAYRRLTVDEMPWIEQRVVALARRNGWNFARIGGSWVEPAKVFRVDSSHCHALCASTRWPTTTGCRQHFIKPCGTSGTCGTPTPTRSPGDTTTMAPSRSSGPLIKTHRHIKRNVCVSYAARRTRSPPCLHPFRRHRRCRAYRPQQLRWSRTRQRSRQRFATPIG